MEQSCLAFLLATPRLGGTPYGATPVGEVEPLRFIYISDRSGSRARMNVIRDFPGFSLRPGEKIFAEAGAIKLDVPIYIHVPLLVVLFRFSDLLHFLVCLSV